MLTSRVVLRALLENVRVPCGPVCAVRFEHTRPANYVAHRFGNRDKVGYGWNGYPFYADRSDFPMPAIRYKENTPDVLALREKEKGDWRKLSKEEKKALYRASFCQTFSEFLGPTGEWKGIIGWTIILASLALWVYMAMRLWVLNELPITLSPERQKAQLRRILDLKMNPVDGISSKWDYENNRWK